MSTQHLLCASSTTLLKNKVSLLQISKGHGYDYSKSSTGSEISRISSDYEIARDKMTNQTEGKGGRFSAQTEGVDVTFEFIGLKKGDGFAFLSYH